MSRFYSTVRRIINWQYKGTTVDVREYLKAVNRGIENTPELAEKVEKGQVKSVTIEH